MKKFKKLGILLLAGIITFGFTACGSSGGSYSKSDSASYSSAVAESATGDYYNEEAYYDDYGYESELAVENGKDYDSSSSSKPEEVNDSARKLIKTHNIDVETEYFDEFVAMVQDKVAQVGGYIQNLNTYNGSSYSGYSKARYSYLTLRIPVKETDAFLKMVGENANITNQTLSVEDVTLSYVDLESKKKTYKAEEERLLTFLEQAQTIEEMLAIEERLTDLRYKLESMESQLRTYDNLVDYTTIYMNISEVEVYSEPEPETWGQQVSRSFDSGINRVVRGFKNFVIDLVGALPVLVVYIIVLGILFLIIFAIVKGVNRHNLKKNARLQAMYAQQVQQAQAPVNQVNATNAGQNGNNTNGQ